MKGITTRKIVICITFVILLIVFPYIANGVLTRLNSQYLIEVSSWNDIVAIAIPSALTCLVVWQSAQQQNQNIVMQKRMEEISAKMLAMELKSGIGYLRPYFSVKDAGAEGSSRQPYPYKLDKYISLLNSGENDFFVVSVKFKVNGNEYIVPDDTPLFISKRSPFNEFCLETNCLSNELNCTQIDMEIEFNLRTINGFNYKQLLFLGFENSDKIGFVDKFNIKIQEVPTDAD